MLLGSQKPRICSFPEYASSTGDEAVELCAMAGLVLDPAQQLVLKHGLGEKPNGKWASFEVAVCEPRQNGKNAILEARELAGLYLLNERLIIHSAHMFDTALDSLDRLLALIEGCPDLDRRVAKVSRSHGMEGITLTGGQRIRFRTRTKGGGRGFSGDLVLIDEAMVLPESFHGALMPVLSAKSVHGNPQMWYTGSAVDQVIHEYGRVFSSVRDRGIKGNDPSLAYFEWSLDCPDPSDVDDELASSPAAWAEANPAFGIRISQDHIGYELRSMDRRTFAVERLGVGDWWNLEGEAHVIDLDLWRSLADEQSVAPDPVCFALDVSPARSWGSISAAGVRADDRFHLELVEHHKGTGWIVGRCQALLEKHRPLTFVVDGKSPAASLLHDLEEADIPVTEINATEHGQACGLFFDLVEQKQLRHLGQPDVLSALKGAAQRPLGDAWAWSRKNSSTDITPLVSLTLALWGMATQEGVSVYESRGALVFGGR